MLTSTLQDTPRFHKRGSGVWVMMI